MNASRAADLGLRADETKVVADARAWRVIYTPTGREVTSFPPSNPFAAARWVAALRRINER